MQKSTKGFALIMVLLFLQLISLLSIYQLLHASENVRQLKKAQVFAQNLYAAKLALISLERDFLLQGTKCEIEEISAIFFKKAAVEFWQQKACPLGIGGRQYFYVVERLASDACAAIVDLGGNQETGVQYYRITLARLKSDLSEKNVQDKIILQSTLAKVGSLRISCASGRLPHKVYLGSQMRRILTA